MSFINKVAASEKWCPFKDQLYKEQRRGIVVPTNSLPENNCIVDSCIMWEDAPNDPTKGNCKLKK